MEATTHIPATARLRAEQVESWAYQAATWNVTGTLKTIETHYSANAILQAVAPEEKADIQAAWDKGYKNGRAS